MVFRIELESPAAHDYELTGDVIEELDGFESLVMVSCQLLSEAGCRFMVGGFGQEVWPVSVDYDLSTVIEQLPTLVSGIRAGETAELDFYAQGTERILDFVPLNGALKIRCRSGTSWTPVPQFEYSSREEVESMFTRLAANFASTLQRVAPKLGALAPFPEWASGRL